MLEMFSSKPLSSSIRNMWSVPALVLRTVSAPWSTWGGLSPGSSTCWGLTSLKAALQRRTLGSQWRTSWTWASNASLQEKSPTASGTALLTGQGGWSPPLSIGETHLEYCAQFWAPPYKEDTGLLEWIQQSVTKIFKGVEHVAYKEWLRKLTF